MSDTPPNTITLQEAYQCFRSQLERDLPELSPAPELPELEFEPAGETSTYPEIGNEDERAPALQWWREVENRTTKASKSFKLALTNGEVEFTVYDKSTRNYIRITPAEWEAIKPVFGGLLSIFETPSLSLSVGSQLARHNGLTAFTDSQKFHSWLKSRSQAGGRSGRPALYDWPSFEMKALQVLDERGDVGFPGEPSWNQAALEREMADWCASHWGQEPAESSRRTHVKLAILKFREGRRAENRIIGL